MHDTMMSALQGGDSLTSSGLKVRLISCEAVQTPRELEIASNLHRREVMELKMDFE